MGQNEIMRVLEKLDDNEWISSTELLKKTKCTRSTLSISLCKLRKFNEVESREMPNRGQNHELEHRLTWKGRK